MNGRESPQDTLQQYFDDLLQETPAVESLTPVAGKPEPAPAPEQPTDEVAAERIERVAKLLQTQPLIPEPQPPANDDQPAPVPAPVETQPVAEVVPEAPEPEPVTGVAPQPVEAPVLDETAEVVAADAPLMERVPWLENGRPPWAQERFEALLFQVSGLTLAVPLIALGQIQPLNGELTPLFGQADWFMGLQPTPVGDIRTVNTAKFVMPERYDERFPETARYVISINGLPWGLAVDSVHQPITLDPDGVMWRTERSRRPWLAGTVKAHMCALIDIPMMGQMLVDAEG